MNNKKKLGFREKFAYGMGDCAANVYVAMAGTFLSGYYTDTVGISILAVGTMMLLTRIFDGVTDLLMGALVDKTKELVLSLETTDVGTTKKASGDLGADGTLDISMGIGAYDGQFVFAPREIAEIKTADGYFKILDAYLDNPPFYHTIDQIIKVKDSSGHDLLTQYTQLDLEDHLKELTTNSVNNELPKLLIFKVMDGQSYYIYKEKVMPLILRLVNDCRVIIKESLSVAWFKYLLDWETLPEMKENAAFERCLQRELSSADPILYAILNSSFLPVAAMDNNTPNKINLYREGDMIPYSEILMISRQEVYSGAEIKLPFWYHLPVLSWILSLVHRKPKDKKRRDSKTSATARLQAEKTAKANAKMSELEAMDASDPKNERKKQLRKGAVEIESKIVPRSSTLDRELDSYMREWNDRIDEKSHQNLIDDVNACVRDYVRRTIRQLRSESFTEERIDALAQSLVDSPSMSRIKNHPALKMYIKLYMVKLIKNIP